MIPLAAFAFTALACLLVLDLLRHRFDVGVLILMVMAAYGAYRLALKKDL